MYYKNIKDYDQLQSQHEEDFSADGAMLTVVLAVMLAIPIGLITAFFI